MTRPWIAGVRLLLASIALLVALVGSAASADTEPEAEAEPAAGSAASDEALRLGAEVYSRSCSSCHQPGGAGLPGQFPPLVGNPNVDDTAYMEDVIVNGQRGEIEVGGQTYDGVMPPFSTLSDGEVAAVIAYVQADFTAPQAAIEAFDAGDPSAGGGLPAWVGVSLAVALVVLAGAGAVVAAPRVLTANDRLATPWLDAWSKTAAIVVAAALLTVVVPNWVLKSSAVTGLGRFWQDAIGSGLWAAGLATLLAGLWWAHRESRV